MHRICVTLLNCCYMKVYDALSKKLHNLPSGVLALLHDNPSFNEVRIFGFTPTDPDTSCADDDDDDNDDDYSYCI